MSIEHLHDHIIESLMFYDSSLQHIRNQARVF